MEVGREDEKKRFTDALERGAVTLRLKDKNLIATFHEPFHTHFKVYDGSVPGYYVEGTMPKYLQDIAKEYVKKAKRSR